jgi:hypothetical protein
MYAELWDAWIEKRGGDTSVKPSKDRIIEWTSKAWTHVSRDTVINGWKVYESFRGEIESASMSFKFFSFKFYSQKRSWKE